MSESGTLLSLRLSPFTLDPTLAGRSRALAITSPTSAGVGPTRANTAVQLRPSLASIAEAYNTGDNRLPQLVPVPAGLADAYYDSSPEVTEKRPSSIAPLPRPRRPLSQSQDASLADKSSAFFFPIPSSGDSAPQSPSPPEDELDAQLEDRFWRELQREYVQHEEQRFTLASAASGSHLVKAIQLNDDEIRLEFELHTDKSLPSPEIYSIELKIPTPWTETPQFIVSIGPASLSSKPDLHVPLWERELHSRITSYLYAYRSHYYVSLNASSPLDTSSSSYEKPPQSFLQLLFDAVKALVEQNAVTDSSQGTSIFGSIHDTSKEGLFMYDSASTLTLDRLNSKLNSDGALEGGLPLDTTRTRASVLSEDEREVVESIGTVARHIPSPVTSGAVFSCSGDLVCFGAGMHTLYYTLIV